MRSTSNRTNKWENNHFLKDIYFSHCFSFCVCAGIKDMEVELSTVPQLGTVPPLAGRCGSGRRDLRAGKGVLSAVRLGRVIPRGGSSGSKKGKPTFFFIVKDAVECDGLISNQPGRWISERKKPTKVRQGRERGKDAASRGFQLSGRVWLWMNLSSASVSPVAPHELKPGKLWIYPGVISLTGQQTSGGKVWISVFAPVLTFVWGDQGNKRARSAASWVGPSRDCRSLNCGKFFNPPPPFACSSPPPLLV